MSERHDNRIAALLADSLGTDAWAASRDVAVTSDAHLVDMAGEAVRLYREIEPVSHAVIWTDDEATPVECAAAVLGEIADGYALQAISWDSDQRGTLPYPSRPTVEAFIHAQGIEDWASALGYPLPLSASPIDRQESTTVPPDAAPDLTAVAATFDDALQAYTKMLAIHERREGREILRSSPWRESACRQVASSRTWSFWVRDRLGLVPPYAALAVAMFDIGRGCFLLSFDTSGISPFATRPYLRDLLRKGGADRWLMSHGGDPATWLRLESP